LPKVGVRLRVETAKVKERFLPSPQKNQIGFLKIEREPTENVWTPDEVKSGDCTRNRR
jgi:hypothetical protein